MSNFNYEYQERVLVNLVQNPIIACTDAEHIRCSRECHTSGGPGIDLQSLDDGGKPPFSVRGQFSERTCSMGIEFNSISHLQSRLFLEVFPLHVFAGFGFGAANGF